MILDFIKTEQRAVIRGGWRGQSSGGGGGGSNSGSHVLLWKYLYGWDIGFSKIEQKALKKKEIVEGRDVVQGFVSCSGFC